MAASVQIVTPDTRRTVPFSDLAAQNESIRAELDSAVGRVVTESSFVLGSAVESFEVSFAEYCEADYAVGCNSGTSAIHLALRALDIGPGDEVITVSHTFIGTVWGIIYAGATPVFVDVEPDTLLMDTGLIEGLITERTKAIVPVHLYGHPVDMDPLLDIARKHDLYVIEDAAQAHGARYKGQRVGALGDIGCFSFYPGKNLGAWGEAGAVVTRDRAIAKRVRHLRDHAQSERYHHQEIGFNYRMDGIQGAVLGIKLSYLDEWNRLRRALANRYNEQLTVEEAIRLTHVRSWAEPVYHLYVVRHRDRDVLKKDLAEAGVATGLHYPVPVHKQPAAINAANSLSSLSQTDLAAAQVLSLPLYAEMDNDAADHVVASVSLSLKELES